jgi:outer membrane protein TolC
MRHKVLLPVICAALVLSLRGAPQTSNQPLTLEECKAIAIQQNPLIQSSMQYYQASLARVQQARAFSQPSIDYDSDVQPRFLDFRGSGESYFGLSQDFSFPGKRSLRGKIATQESKEFEVDTELLKRDILYQVKQAFFGLLLAQEMLKYAEQDRELSQDYLQKSEIKFQAGDVARVEVLRARVETAKAENSVKAAANEIRLAKAKLNFLLARKKYEALEISGQFRRYIAALLLDDLMRKAMAFRPELRRLGFSMEKEKARKTLAYLGYLPDFSVGVARHRLAGAPTTWDFVVSFPIPLFFWQPQKGEVAEAEANLRALSEEKEHVANAIALEVEEAHANAIQASAQIELFEKEILRQAEEAYNMILFSFQEGEIGGIELIEARRTLIGSRRSYADALYNFSVALAAVEKSVGLELEDDSHE